MRIMKSLVFSLAVFVSLVVVAKTDDRTVFVASEDKEMNAAIEKARSTLDAFLRLKANPPKGASGFKLKVKITDNNGSEHMWVTPFAETAAGFSGTIADEPEIVASVANGREISFTRQDISDWGFVQDGKQKGSFTVCVLLKHIPRAEVDAYRRDYGFEC
jgi:uncharacterized protein YegJ (DUF2314 family)